ncbi:putative sulfate exporter family transporter [uncultured Jannaschia sp.]|uniref:YeiH family protein n=1 Tax=uncultured Jannaschia sp. TaxID=293347 RepID=UPI002625A7EF|nr:putative sulfate exporter family transporter [uncultured Jannaschia sp.]
MRGLTPGVVLAFVVAAAATFLSEHYGAPVMLFALLIGMALHFLATDPRAAAGIDFTAKRLLRVGIALLGARITFGQVAELGATPIALVLVCLTATIAFGLLLARVMGRSWSFGMLTAGSVAICGASAALAISAVLPHSETRERDTLFTVVAVTGLSTIAMVLYPILFAAIGFDEITIGILLGATIHDVAQVVGAGYAVSAEAGDAATLVKLLRVALMPVVVLVLVLLVSRRSGARAPMPVFALVFVLILAANSLDLIPGLLQAVMVDVSRWLLVAAIAALGIKTSLQAMFEGGPGHTLIVLTQTVFLAALATALLVLF